MQSSEGPVSLAAAPSQTSFYVDESGTGVYRVDSGFDLDRYLYRSSGPLDFAIDVGTNFGPVDADGYPVPGHALYGLEAHLTVRVYDVDDDYAGGGFAPERDLLVVNGIPVGDYLSGADNQWSINTIRVPLNLLRFPTPSNPAGRNDMQVLIDTANTGGDVWAVQVAWAELRMTSEVRPLAMIHGFGGGANDFAPADGTGMDAYYRSKFPALTGRIAVPDMTSRGSIEADRGLLEQPIADLLASSGSYQVNLLAHSKGGLAARLYAWDHPAEVKQLVMMGTPNGGTRIANIVCRLEVPDIGGTTLRDALQEQFGPCDGPQDGLYQLQEPYVQDVFNKQVPDRKSTFMFTIAGQGNDPRNILIDGEDDGLVSVNSVEYLSTYNEAKRGQHFPLAVFNVNHTALLDAGGPTAPTSICTLYATACGDAFSRRAAPAAPAAASSSVALEASVAAGEPTVAAGVTVPARGSVDVPVAFEGAPLATVLVVGPSTLSASLGTTALTRGPLLGGTVLGAELASPAPGTVRITNSSANATEAALLVGVQTDRRLTVQATPALAAAGQPVVLSASLTVADSGDAPRAIVTDADGATVADMVMTASSPGAWTATFTPERPGSYKVSAAVAGARPRYAGDVLTVSSGAVALAGGFTQSLRDSNSNGLANDLLIAAGVQVSVPGSYRLAARIVDSAGMPVAAAGARAVLAVGSQRVTLAFDGRDIFASARSGPYRVVDAVLSRDDTTMALEQIVPTLGSTAGYDYRRFEHHLVEIDPDGFTDTSVDHDSDGLFDALAVGGRVSVETGGSYAVNARLLAPNGTELGEFQTVTTMTAGPNGFTLSFPWGPIRAAGQDGPFTVEDLSIYPLANSDALGFMVFAHRTAPYPASGELEQISFERLRAMVTAASADGGIDGEGLVQSLQAKLNAAESARDRGNTRAARNSLEAFRSELWAQRGKQITEAAYLRLDTAAEQLASRL